MSSIGPIYCETPAVIASFPAEPINTFSNLAILFGLAAFYILWKRKAAPDLFALAFFLLATGIGSFLWHAMRTETTLILDAGPGIVFILILVFAWGRRLFGARNAVAVLLGFFGVSTAITWAAAQFGIAAALRVPLILILLLGIAFLYLSYRRFGSIIWIGAAAVVSGALALTLRSIDLYTCTTLSFGTHFLWHVFLSLGGFLCILFLLRMDEKSPIMNKT